MLEKGKISICLTFPLFLSPCSQSLAALRNPGQGELSSGQLLAGGVTRLVSAWTLVCFGSSFSSHTLTAASILLPYPLLQDSCAPYPISEPSPSPCSQGQQEGEGLFSPVPPGFFPSSVHTRGNKGLPRVSGQLLLHIPGHLSQEPLQVAPARARRVPESCGGPPAVFHQLLHHTGGNCC